MILQYKPPSYRQVQCHLPKSSTVRLGIIGCGGIMQMHMKGLVRRGKEVSIAWLCDVDPQQTEKVAKILSGSQSTPPRRTQRHEDVLEVKDVLEELLSGRTDYEPLLPGCTGLKLPAKLAPNLCDTVW